MMKKSCWSYKGFYPEEGVLYKRRKENRCSEEGCFMEVFYAGAIMKDNKESGLTWTV